MHVVFFNNQMVFYLVRPEVFLFMVSYTAVAKVTMTQSVTTHTRTCTHSLR